MVDTQTNKAAQGEEVTRTTFVSFTQQLQREIIAGLEMLEAKCARHFDRKGVAEELPKEPAHFLQKYWERWQDAGAAQPASGKSFAWCTTPSTSPYGGGLMCLMEDGFLFEKAGIHTSCVRGTLSKEFAKSIPGADEDPAFWAAGLSLIIHPRNPHVPSIHMNLRRICTTKSWYGGGIDLSPMLPAYRGYPFETQMQSKDAWGTFETPHEDTRAFHEALKALCSRHDESHYVRYKQSCDGYFYLPHRSVPRGVGGLFCDNITTGNPEEDLAFIKDMGSSFLQIYGSLVEKHMLQPWTPKERLMQQRTRSLYVEFNLLYDRGTLFGLKVGGNVEAILSSLPPTVRW